MDSVTKEKNPLNAVYVQIMIVVAVFITTGIFCVFFTRHIERLHLRYEAEKAIVFAENKLLTGILEPKIFFNSYSDNIRSAVMQEWNVNSLSAYIKDITNYFLGDDSLLPGFNRLHGYFESLGGVYINGLNRTPYNYELNIHNYPWYTAAVSASGEVSVTEPYYDPAAEATIITYARQLFDDDLNPLGVICLDINIGRIIKHITEVKLTEGSYGFLLDRNFNLIAHALHDRTGMHVSQSVEANFAVFTDDLEMGLDIIEGRARNFNRRNVIVFISEISGGTSASGGWYLGIAVPSVEYYRNFNNMMLIVILLAGIFITTLVFMLYKLSFLIKRSDMRTRQKSDFLATMSHEIRTPLNAILGLTEIQMQNTAHPPSTSEAFLKINNSGNLLLSIINDILDLSKIETGKLELTPAKYDVASLINDIIQINFIRYESTPVDFKVEIDENIPSVLIGDELRIKQILNNLLSNAFKYTDSGEVTLKVSALCVGRG